jgi:mRNA-degrading endonuclease YafQ of YafQ-DinJ toxin-antitoxin module
MMVSQGNFKGVWSLKIKYDLYIEYPGIVRM